jgi:exopolysaccharide biosynthesis polyprenyl glycosylphosphotransferase
MIHGGRKSFALLFLGDIAVFMVSLWLTLLVRYREVPGEEALGSHGPAFALLFILWVLVFYMAGLYSKRIILLKHRLFGMLAQVQFLNIVLAALFFFFVPGIGIAPKTNLLLYLGISLVLICVWRVLVFPKLSRPAARERAAVIGSGHDVDELVHEVNNNPHYRLQFPLVIKPEEFNNSFDTLATQLQQHQVSLLVIDTTNDSLHSMLGRIYELAFVTRSYQVADLHQIYEEVFDRVPLSLLQYEWFLRNLSDTSSQFYEAMKRVIDILGALVMGCITVALIPVVWIAMRLEGPGPLFIRQDRIGMYGSCVKTYKFRSMQKNDVGFWKGEGVNRVTRVGEFLRLTSLDEFPQFINVLSGELSLIGPRNDMAFLAERLAKEIPYYNVRYLAKPGITGWAQINQQYEQGNISPQSIHETKTRLAYDFYYIKNRSLTLDIAIALKTFKRMLFRVSSW